MWFDTKRDFKFLKGCIRGNNQSTIFYKSAISPALKTARME